jgi:hypothetical protein
MKVFTCLIVIRLISINCQQVLYKDLRGFQNTQFTNLKILENSLDSRSSVRSTLFCNGFCLENSRCLSCAFNNIMKLCVLCFHYFLLSGRSHFFFSMQCVCHYSIPTPIPFMKHLGILEKHILFVSVSFLCRYPIILKCCISF